MSTPTRNSTSYLDPQTLATIAGIEMRARMIVEGLMQGMHRSPHQGISVEFAQHRPYVPGDDLRHLDWKVFARTDKLYLKQYQQETNLDLILLVDTSGSMAYAGDGATGSGATGGGANGGGKQRDKQRGVAGAGAVGGGVWRKYDCAASLAAAMAYLALRQQDRVGVWLFNKRVVGASRLSNSQGHWRTITELLAQAQLTDAQQPAALSEDVEQASTTNFERIFNRIFSQVSQRSLFVLISDLFEEPGALEKGLARLHHRRHDVMLLRTLDPAELTFPFRSPTEFVGLEAEGKLPVDPASLRKAYLDVLGEHLRAVEQVARKFRFDYLLVDTMQPVGPPLSHFLARRAASIAKD